MQKRTEFPFEGDKESGIPHRPNRKMEEVKETKEKKARKPRAKKAQTEETAAPVLATQEETAEKPKKRTATRKKKAVEKTVEVPVEEVAEQPVEQPVGTPIKRAAAKEEQPAKKKTPAKRTAKKKVVEEAVPVKEETPKEEAVIEEPKKVEEKTAEPKKQPKEKQVKEKQPTRAERIEAVKTLVRETLQTECKWNDLLDKVVGLYKEKYPTEKSEKINDLNGRIGSIIGQMKKDGEVTVEGGVATLLKAVEKPVVAVEKAEEKKEEKPQETVQEKKEEHTEKAAEKATVYDLSSLFTPRKPVKAEPKEEDTQKAVEKALVERTQEVENTAPKKETAEKKAVVKKDEKPAVKVEKKPVSRKVVKGHVPEFLVSKDPLKDAFLKKLRSLGGDYFEYYSIYLLEKYSRKNGRRLEGLKVSGGERDGGIDGEIEVSDRLGFRETLYVQAKNWQPTDEKWMVGETLLQQFIGAVTYRQVKEGKQHARGVFMTTSRFTPEAKKMLADMSDKFVGYDGDDLYETAKECSFGLREENGVWKIDEVLLAGEKAFFNM